MTAKDGVVSVPHFSTKCREIESLALEIIYQKRRATIVSVPYRSPNGHFEHFEKFTKKHFFKQNL